METKHIEELLRVTVSVHCICTHKTCYITLQMLNGFNNILTLNICSESAVR